jgi:hypothetical protein
MPNSRRKKERLSNGDISPTWSRLNKSEGVVEKEIVFSNSEDMVSQRVSGLVLNESLAVVDIEVIEEETIVYNFEVEDDHTYFVTEAEVWVHNADYIITSNRSGILSVKGSLFGEDIDPSKIILEQKNGKTFAMVKDKFNNILEYELDPKKSAEIDLAQGIKEETARPLKVKINGRLLENGGVVSMNSETGRLDVINSSQVKDNSVVLVTGQDNDANDALSTLETLRPAQKGKSVYLSYNPTKGGVGDTWDSTKMRFDNKSKARESVNTVSNLAASGKNLTFIGHSQGAIVAGNGLNDAIKNRDADPQKFKLIIAGGAHLSENIPNNLKEAIFIKKTFDPVIDSVNLPIKVNSFLQNVLNVFTPILPGRDVPVVTETDQWERKMQNSNYKEIKSSGVGHSYRENYSSKVNCVLQKGTSACK